MPSDGHVIIDIGEDAGTTHVIEVTFFNGEVLTINVTGPTTADDVYVRLTKEEAVNLGDQLEDSAAEHRSWSERYRYKQTQDWHDNRANILEGIERKVKAGL